MDHLHLKHVVKRAAKINPRALDSQPSDLGTEVQLHSGPSCVHVNTFKVTYLLQIRSQSEKSGISS